MKEERLTKPIRIERITSKICYFRKQQVLLDKDLAELYQVETLDGVETVGFLNGSKLRQYYDPLTIETIQVARDKQATREKELKYIQDAIKESKVREAKIKQKHQSNVWIYDVFTGESNEDDYTLHICTPKLDWKPTLIRYCIPP